jgi:hypothetical protein
VLLFQLGSDRSEDDPPVADPEELRQSSGNVKNFLHHRTGLDNVLCGDIDSVK